MEYEKINHPEHYMVDGKECIDIIEDILGTDGAIAFCKGNVIKYGVRAGNKPNCPAEEDMEKMSWYENKAEELEADGRRRIIRIGTTAVKNLMDMVRRGL